MWSSLPTAKASLRYGEEWKAGDARGDGIESNLDGGRGDESELWRATRIAAQAEAEASGDTGRRSKKESDSLSLFFRRSLPSD